LDRLKPVFLAGPFDGHGRIRGDQIYRERCGLADPVRRAKRIYRHKHAVKGRFTPDYQVTERVCPITNPIAVEVATTCLQVKLASEIQDPFV
jgi:hypothetical protein